MPNTVMISYVHKEGATGGLGENDVVRSHLINGASEVAIVQGIEKDAHIMADPKEVDAYGQFLSSIPGARLSEITQEGGPGEAPIRFDARKLKLRGVRVVAR